MTKKIFWLIVSCLMVLSLVLASCGPKEEEEAKITEEGGQVITTKEKEKEEEKEEVVVTPDVPKHGGILTLFSADPTEFDNLYGWRAQTVSALCNDELWIGDWAKGPAGTGECSWADVMTDLWSQKAGCIAESWDFSRLESDLIITWHIRKGMHWALDPNNEASRLVNGREVTAYDVAWTFERACTDPRAYIYTAAPDLRNVEITVPDKYTIVMKIPSLLVVESALCRFGDFIAIYPPEPAEKYGGYSDWRNYVGSGPFMLTDYVPAGSLTYTRNPNYWETDPVGLGKGNQLPYVDICKMVIIADLSTRVAALRTGKIDHLYGQSQDTAKDIWRLSPQIKYVETLSGHCRPTVMRTDKPDLPFHDIQVRRALMMATDYDTMIETIYEGKGDLPSWPLPYVPEYADAYLSLDDPECPESVKELYVYNPEKAKQLLTEAGYPNGFKAKVVITNDTTTVDRYSVLKDMWAKVGVDIELEPIEGGVWNSVSYTRAYDEMFFGSHAGVGTLYRCMWFSGEQTANGSYIDDPYINETRDKMLLLVGKGKQNEANAMFKELLKYVLDQAWAIPWPNEYVVSFWWPWLKNFNGENSLGYHNVNKWAKYVWIDEILKKSMGF